MRAWVCLAAVVSFGCGYTRVTIVAPRLDSSAEREQAWKDFQPVGHRTVETYSQQGPASPERRGLHLDLESIRLGNGVEVEDPRDLIPLVPDSTTASLARSWGGKRFRWDAHLWAALGTFVAGATGLLTTGVFGDAFGADAGSVYWKVSLGTLLVGPLLNILLPALLVGKIDQLRVDAFVAYWDDLRSALRPGF